MGHIMIKDDVRLVDVSTRTLRKADIIRSGDTVFIRYEKPKHGDPEFSVCRLYTTEKWAFPMCLSSWPWQKDFMDVLVRLGLMSKERQSELIEIDGQRQIEKQRKYDVEDLERISKRYPGLENKTKALIQAVEKAA